MQAAETTSSGAVIGGGPAGLKAAAELARPRGPRFFRTHLKSCPNLAGVKAGLPYTTLAREAMADPVRLAVHINSLPITVRAPRPFDETIGSAGSARFEVLDAHAMLRAIPAVFCAGERLDCETPTGGYLPSACFGTRRAAGQGALAWLQGP